MTRPRLAKNKALGTLPLYPTTIKGSVYYRFKDPITKRFFSLGTDKAAAVKAATALMARRQVDTVERLIRRVDGTRKTLPMVCDAFGAELDARDLSRATMATYVNLLKRLRARFKETGFALVSRGDLAAFLAEMPPRQSNLARGLFVQLWQFAIGHGYAEVNVAEQTLKKSSQKARQRLTEDGYNAIREKAEAWLRPAMDLALYSIQRREDLATAKVEQWDAAKGVFRVTQSKTGKSLAITAGDQLRKAIEACLAIEPRDAPTLLRVPRGDGRHKNTDVSPDHFTNAFAEARDKVPAYKKLAGINRPTLHELRSLGAALYLWKCRDIDLVQKLLGHQTRQMTLNYLSGHELPPEVVASG